MDLGVMSFLTQTGGRGGAGGGCLLAASIQKYLGIEAGIPPPHPDHGETLTFMTPARTKREGCGVGARVVTDSVDSREPEDWVSRLLRLLERSLGEEGGEPP